MSENCGYGLGLQFPVTNGMLIKNGLPAGGTEGQVLAKSSDEDYKAEWVDGAGGGGGVFWADGSTKSAEIEEAYQAGKIVLRVMSGAILRLSFRLSATFHVFSGMYYLSPHDVCRIATCSNDSWSTVATFNLDEFITPDIIGDVEKFRETRLYQAGTHVFYNGIIYTLTEKHSAMEEWDADKAERYDIVQKIDALEAQVQSLINSQ